MSEGDTDAANYHAFLVISIDVHDVFSRHHDVRDSDDIGGDATSILPFWCSYRPLPLDSKFTSSPLTSSIASG